MTKEEAKKIIREAVNNNGVATISDDYKEGFNDGVEFMKTMIEIKLRPLRAILIDPPHVD